MSRALSPDQFGQLGQFMDISWRLDAIERSLGSVVRGGDTGNLGAGR